MGCSLDHICLSRVNLSKDAVATLKLGFLKISLAENLDLMHHNLICLNLNSLFLFLSFYLLFFLSSHFYSWYLCMLID
jgi:hypothetical protein